MVGTRFWPYLASTCVSEAEPEAFTYEGRGSSSPFPLVFRARMRRIPMGYCILSSCLCTCVCYGPTGRGTRTGVVVDYIILHATSLGA
eukprot:5193285-Prymnesium_polylepis.1